MKRGNVLKQFLQGMGDPSGLYVTIDEDFNSIPVEAAVRIWEKLNEDIPEEKKPERPEKPVKKDAPKAGKKKPLDEGKLLALRKAGWSFEKIADELGCATQTIINRYKELTKEEKK